jgi:hypothetical protein
LVSQTTIGKTCPNNNVQLGGPVRTVSSGRALNEIISMAFVPEKLSVTTTQTTHRKTRIGSGILPCFSKLLSATTPFFRQWYIHAVDISKIMSVNKTEARQVMQELRSFFGKSKRDVLTVEEFCAFTGISKSNVRMHLVARVLEHELKKQLQASSRKPQALRPKL